MAPALRSRRTHPCMLRFAGRLFSSVSHTPQHHTSKASQVHIQQTGVKRQEPVPCIATSMHLTASFGLGLLLATSRGAPPTLADDTCAVDSEGQCKAINIVCDSLEDHQIDWDCVFGPESLEEVHQRGGLFTTCPTATKDKPCSRFIVKKEAERSEVKVQRGPKGFPFLYGEKYIFKYSFKAVEDMKVATRFTHLGQLKGSAGGYMIKGDPIYSLTANRHGLQVRFSNLESIEDFHPGMAEELDWDKATGDWVHVEIITTFGESMVVNISGAVNGQAVWPGHLKPVAWHRDSEMVRMKLGLYHSINNVHDGEVEYRDISIEGPNGIIRTSPSDGPSPSPPPPPPPQPQPIDDTCAVDSEGKCKAINTFCDSLEDHQIDWDCVFGPESLEEVHQRGGLFTTCPTATKDKPCSRFIVKKEAERSEVKVQRGPKGFPFLRGEKYIFKYSFKAVEDMKVATRFTHLGQLKGSAGGYMIKGDPIYSLTANRHGLQVRFSNLESIEDFHPGMAEELDWDKATGDWVHVEIITTFGESMVVNISGAVNGQAVWPGHLKPVAWHRDSEMVRMKLGLYHSINNVHDGEVEYRDISIEGPNGIIRTSPRSTSPPPTPPPTFQYGKDQTMCDALSGNTIDWECVFGEGSLVEVNKKGGMLSSCPSGSKLEPCSRFIVPKEQERAEVLVKNGPAGFKFRKGETYVFSYSFRAKDGMRVSGSSTRLGQMKGVSDGKQVSGTPLLAVTATNSGLNVRFSNDGAGYEKAPKKSLSWEDAAGEWVHVEIRTTFGQSMEVSFSGAVDGTAVWPSSYQPVAWHDDADKVMFKLGLYHIRNKVADAEVEYKNVSIEGPNRIVTTSAVGVLPEGITALGCAKDVGHDRILSNRHRSDKMVPELCAEYCEGEEFFGVQNGNECWCAGEKDVDELFRHGKGSCNKSCTGNSKKSCGGVWAMSLYHYGATLISDPPEGSKYLGCYKDSKSDRALSHKSTSRSDMSHERCLDFCNDSKKSKYFAVQAGKECYCGQANEKYDKHGKEICDLPCSGDNSLTCGGYEASNVFSIY